MRCFALTCVLVSFLLCPPTIEADTWNDFASPYSDLEDLQLVKAVVLCRHGIRSPVQTAEELASWSRRPWPDWQTAPGALTERGAALIAAAWQGIRQELAENGLMPRTGCPPEGSVFLYADSCPRTLSTAEAILQGFAPTCGFRVHYHPKGRDALFHPVQQGFLPAPVFPAEERRKILQNLESIQRKHEPLLAELAELLGPEPSGRQALSIVETPSSLLFPAKDSHRSLSLHGGLGIAASTAEILLLEALEWPAQSQRIAVERRIPRPSVPISPVAEKTLQIITAPRRDQPDTVPLPPAPHWENAPLPQTGPILVPPQTALHLLPLHTDIQNAIHRTPSEARSAGLPLLTLITEILAGKSPLEEANRASLVIFSGHDTNIASIAGILGLNWQNGAFPPNSIPPGSMLFFGVWETAQGAMVRPVFLCQTPAAFLSTDPTSESSAALTHSSLLPKNILAEPPTSSGIPLDRFVSAIQKLSGPELSSRLADMLGTTKSAN